MVKPILKKRSHSEKNSLDLDRPWEEQQVPGMSGLISGYESTGPARSARDVSFSLADSSVFTAKQPRYGHGRSHSGNSHVSVATTASGGGSRPSTFIHPFQQTPRTQTPPLTYADSVASLDNGATSAFSFNAGASSTRDYSPTITENDDDYDDDGDSRVGSLPSYRYHHSRTASLSQSSLRHPSLVNQRAASFSDINAAPPLRLNTARSVPGGRRVPGSSSLASSLSHSDLHLHASEGSAVLDSPSSGGPTAIMTSFAPSDPIAATASNSTSTTPLSPLRSSLEYVAFPRIRSRSEVDTNARADQIREARRKFEERERAKVEKHDREMLRKRERRDNKEAKATERHAAAQLRKNSGTGSDSGGRPSRPSLSRKSTPTFGSNSGIALASGSGCASGTGLGLGLGSALGSGSGPLLVSGDSEKGRDSGRYSRTAPSAPEMAEEKPLAFKSNKYDNVAGGTTPKFGPSVDSVAFKHAQRNNTTKRKTQGYWNGFVLWLRTRLFRMSRN